MKHTHSDNCPTCDLPLTGDWRPFVLLPADDVPASGSRAEIMVSPKRCLRVEARACKQGHLALRTKP